VVIRFAGDSGDGMQLTGDRFTTSSALFGNDLSTLPDFPPRSGRGRHLAGCRPSRSTSLTTTSSPRRRPHRAGGHEPGALKTNLRDLAGAGTLIVNSDAFEERNLTKAGYPANPLEDGSLAGYTVYEVPMTSMTLEAVKPTGAKPRDAERSKNFFALGLVSWLYTRPVEPPWSGSSTASASSRWWRRPTSWPQGRLPLRRDGRAVRDALRGQAAHLPPGTYTNISGNTALAWGIVAAGQLAKLPVFLGSYPITPASDILHELSKAQELRSAHHAGRGRDRRGRRGPGAAFGGHSASPPPADPASTSRPRPSPGRQPRVAAGVIDIQRGGPSTGLPTKTEQGGPAAGHVRASWPRPRCRSSQPDPERLLLRPSSRPFASPSSTAPR